MSIDTQSVEFKFGRLYGRLENNNDWDFETFIEKVNDYKNDLELDSDMLLEVCYLFCSDFEVINYKNRKVVVFGDNRYIRDVVYYCQSDKKVKHLIDYDENEIIDIIKIMYNIQSNDE